MAPFDLGLADTSQVPTKVLTPIFVGVPFGSTATSSASVDENGYAKIIAPGGSLLFGAAPTGTSDAKLVTDTPLAGNDSDSLIAVGSATDVRFPPELIACDEGKTEGIFMRCGSAEPIALTIDVVNPYLWGPIAAAPPGRRDAALKAIAALASDVVCVAEIWSD